VPVKLSIEEKRKCNYSVYTPCGSHTNFFFLEDNLQKQQPVCLQVSILELSNVTYKIFYMMNIKKFLKELRFWCCEIVEWEL